jgi:glycosyltransferase involved in cell wall biosynthesis
MRVCIVTGFFLDEYGYLENVFASELAKMGHTVRVVCAGPRARIEQHGVDGLRFEVQRLPAMVLPSSVRLSMRVGGAVRRFRPDLVLWGGVAQHFGRDLLSLSELAGVPIVSLYSENPDMHEFDWRKRGIGMRQRALALGWRFLKGPIVRRACLRSDLIVGHCAQTGPILLSLFGRGMQRNTIAEKIIDLPLGYDPAVYAYSPQVRQQVRESLGVQPEEILVCMSSRFTEEKRPMLQKNIEGMQQALSRMPRLRGLVIGFCRNEASDRIEQVLASDPTSPRIIRQDFASQQRLCELYNAADIAVFGQATISCQAALGTGLVVCMPDTGTMSNLVRDPRQGHFFKWRDAEDLANCIISAASPMEPMTPPQRGQYRQQMVQASRWLRYDSLIREILRQVSVRTGARTLASATQHGTPQSAPDAAQDKAAGRPGG